MKLRRIFVCGVAGIILVGARIFAADSDPTNAVAATLPVYVPDTSHASEALAPNTLAWDSISKETNVTADVSNAHFVFNFTNISAGNVVILNVRASCGCTTMQLPPLPWIIPAGTNGQIGAIVNFAGKSGPLLKTVTVTSDKGFLTLMLKINIQPTVLPTLTADERERNLIAAKADRQAVFRGDCATCHVKPGEGKYGRALYDAVCAICHEGKDRSTLVPDLHNVKTPTSIDYWQTWIAHGKAGSLMPAFSTAEGGPLADMQITTLANFLATTIPSQPPANK
jgi:mono/diheme cytochrome c family protein